MNITLPTYPGFSDSDWSLSVVTELGDRDELRVEQLTTEAADAHSSKHQDHSHPWCWWCAYRLVNLDIIDAGGTTCRNPALNTEILRAHLYESVDGTRGAVIRSWVENYSEGGCTVDEMLASLRNSDPYQVTDLYPVDIATMWEFFEHELRWKWQKEEAERESASRCRRYLTFRSTPPDDTHDPDSARAHLPAMVRLDDFLSTADDPVVYRVDGLWLSGGRVVLTAPQKAGKTTLVANALRSLVDGQPFLDEHSTQAAGRVVLVDNELDEGMLRRWLRDQGIRNEGHVTLLPLRGRLSAFNILDEVTRARWAAHIGPADVLVLDCLRPALDALRLKEDKEAGVFLTALDALCQEAGIPEAMVIHHTGHDGERARGDSRILDWPDAVWKLAKDGGDTDESRRVYFSAYGRDVRAPERLLEHDVATRRLTVAGGSRGETRTQHVLTDVLAYIGANPRSSGNAIEKSVSARAEHVRAAIVKGVADGLIERRKVGQAFLHTLTSSTSSSLVRDEGTTYLPTPRPLVYDEGRGRGGERTHPTPPRDGTRDEPRQHVVHSSSSETRDEGDDTNQSSLRRRPA